MMRRRGPGLVGVMARTAVIAGTATAVSGAVVDHRNQKAQSKQDAQQALYDQGVADAQAQMQQQAAAAPPPAAVAAPAAGDDMMAQLQKLADLKAAGILSDEEFAAAKAKLLA